MLFFIDSIVSQYSANDNTSYASEGKYILFIIYIIRLI